jgi:predicted unusual protein kinase regulating ubiquinone biosynthesis (AarF/ABC1/UbiB family)
MGKSISTMEGITQELYPDFNPLDAMRPYLVQQYVRRVLDPKNYSRRIYRLVHDYMGLARILPGEIRAVLRRLRAGELHVQHTDVGADLRMLRQERSVNRVLLSVWSVTAWALFTWMLPQAAAAPTWSLMWWYAIVLASQGLGAGTLVLLSLLRSREL